MSLSTPVFTKINENFLCANCNRPVPKAESTCRDHCPNCLFSVHVDNNPGDRAAECGGALKPASYFLHKKKGYMIHYVCQKCNAEKVNRFLENDKNQSDSFDALLKLSSVSPR